MDLIRRPMFLNTTAGAYRLVDFLGAGGMGEVYRAVHTRLGQVVAVKVLMHTGQGEGALARFRNEARIQGRLRHRHIASFYEFAELGGHPCIVMEYVEGPTLEEYLERRGPLPLPDALRIIREVVEAVSYLHEERIVHRDIKSSNIKITPDGSVRLLDFGIAKSDSTARLTAVGAVVGTPEYLSPEQLRGNDADSRADVWALGVLLYEMVTGRGPFHAENLPDLYAKISRTDYVRPSLQNAEVSPDVEAVIARCLKKKPADRYPSATSLLGALAHLGESATSAAALSYRRLLLVAAAVLLTTIYIWRPKLQTEIVDQDSEYIVPLERAETLSVSINVPGGKAHIYELDGSLIGTTPYRVEALRGEAVEFVLRQEGFRDRTIHFDVNERRTEYVFPMEKIDG